MNKPAPAGTNPPLLLDARSAAAALSISPRKLWELTSIGEVPCIRIGRRVLYDPVDLREWIQRRKGASNEK